MMQARQKVLFILCLYVYHYNMEFVGKNDCLHGQHLKSIQIHYEFMRDRSIPSNPWYNRNIKCDIYDENGTLMYIEPLALSWIYDHYNSGKIRFIIKD